MPTLHVTICKGKVKSEEFATAMKKIIPSQLLLILSIALLLSCETDSYEKGQGKYSLMHTDMGEVSIDADKQAVSFTTDDGDNYVLAAPFASQWIQTADTTYRAIIYYNKVENGKAEALGLSSVPTIIPKEHWHFESQTQDPVGFESAWLAKNKKYINLGLLFKSGYVDDAIGHHLISVACDTILVNADQTRTAYYRFLHDQNDTPEHFANRHYISILLPQDLPDSASLSLVTYTGSIERRFSLK